LFLDMVLNQNPFWCHRSLVQLDPPFPCRQCSGPRSVSFGPPGSGSVSQRIGSRSGFFHHQAKIVRKSLTSLWLLSDFLYLKNDVNVPSKINQNLNQLVRSSDPRIGIRAKMAQIQNTV
jgi:hypothetical protein